MKKYKVVFSLDFDIEADEEYIALDEAEQQLAKELENLHCGLTEIFKVDCKEIKNGK